MSVACKLGNAQCSCVGEVADQERRTGSVKGKASLNVAGSSFDEVDFLN
jgi:hypothetical protein